MGFAENEVAEYGIERRWGFAENGSSEMSEDWVCRRCGVDGSKEKCES